jgi:hypothetical protein
MAQVKQIRDAQAPETRVGELDQCLGPVTHQTQDLGAQCRQACVDTAVPGVIAAIHSHCFHQQVATGKVHEHQHHALQEGFIHRPDDWSYLAMGYALLLPRRSGVQYDALQHVHNVA